MCAIAESADNEKDQCYAMVKDGVAVFAFPVEDKGSWVWFSTKTMDDALEYSWEIFLPEQQQWINFGAFLFKFKGQEQKMGTLEQLIHEAQWTVALVDKNPAGGTTANVLEGLTVGCAVINHLVVVGIKDKTTFKEVLGNAA